MIDFVTGLVLSKKLEFDEGEIRLLGSPILLIPPQVYVIALKELEKKGKRDIIYTASFNSSKGWFKNLISNSKGSSKKDLVEMIPRLFSLLALGDLKMVDSDLDNPRFKFTLKNSLTAEIYGESKLPVDLLVSGLLAGAMSEIFGSKFLCVEESCISCGNPDCGFNLVVEKNV